VEHRLSVRVSRYNQEGGGLVAIKQKSSYTLAELHELLERLRTEPISAEELERRRKLSERCDHFLREQEPMDISVEELIRRDQRYGD
jgi:hypothetical protein